MTATTTTTVRGSSTPKKPAERPAPQDHKPKAEKPTVKKVEGGKEVTFKGITVTVDDEALDDFELLDDLRALDEDQNASRLPVVLRRLVGKDGYKTVMDGLRDEKTGRVSGEAGGEFVAEILGALAPNS